MTTPDLEPVVGLWTGAEIRTLRLAFRLGRRDFGRRLGVAGSTVSGWENSQPGTPPRLVFQARLDRLLSTADAVVRRRFVLLIGGQDSYTGTDDIPHDAGTATASLSKPPSDVANAFTHPDMRMALSNRDVGAMFRLLQRHGVSQRRIAALTEQSQSEVSEILAGRRVQSYDVLVRIAEGLGVPRGVMGLAQD